MGLWEQQYLLGKEAVKQGRDWMHLYFENMEIKKK